jgi:hypothetical protein
MRLVQLDPVFLKWERRADGHVYHVKVDTLADAMGVGFLCPSCFKGLGGRIGCHRVICWSENRGTPQCADPKPGRWSLDGTDFTDLTLNGENGRSRSILLMGGCAAHFFITNGEIT